MDMALCSSGEADYVYKGLNDCDIRKYFDVIVCHQEGSRNKSAFDAYLLTLKKLNISRSDCVVIEDSEAGIASAKNAGIKVIARKDGRYGINQSQADKFINDLTELLEKL